MNGVLWVHSPKSKVSTHQWWRFNFLLEHTSLCIYCQPTNKYGYSSQSVMSCSLCFPASALSARTCPGIPYGLCNSNLMMCDSLMSVRGIFMCMTPSPMSWPCPHVDEFVEFRMAVSNCPHNLVHFWQEQFRLLLRYAVWLILQGWLVCL